MTSKKLLVIFALFVVAAGCGKSNDTASESTPIPAVTANCAGQACLDSSLALQVQSQTALSATIALGTEAGQIEAARYLYTYLNGPSDQFSLATTTPSSGLLGVLNALTSILSTGLKANGYSSCSTIPTTGTLTIQEGSDTYSLTFGAATRSLPSSFSTAANFSKQIRVLKNGSLHLIAELACDSGTLVSSYFRMSSLEAGEMEVFSQADSSSHFSQVEFYADGGAKMASRFKTENGADFSLWLVFSAVETPVNLGVEGRRNLSLAHVRTHTGSLADSTAITASSHETCLDLATNGTSTACTTNSIAVADAAVTATLKNAQTYTFDIFSIAGLEVTDLE